MNTRTRNTNLNRYRAGRLKRRRPSSTQIRITGHVQRIVPPKPNLNVLVAFFLVTFPFWIKSGLGWAYCTFLCLTFFYLGVYWFYYLRITEIVRQMCEITVTLSLLGLMCTVFLYISPRDFRKAAVDLVLTLIGWW